MRPLLAPRTPEGWRGDASNPEWWKRLVPHVTRKIDSHSQKEEYVYFDFDRCSAELVAALLQSQSVSYLGSQY